MEIASFCHASHLELDTLKGTLAEGEILEQGGLIHVEFLDGTSADCEILVLHQSEYGYFWEAKRAEGPCTFQVKIAKLGREDVSTPDAKIWQKIVQSKHDLVKLTPFKELFQGEESIYDWVVPGYTAPAKVVLYLKTKFCDLASPGVYDHPFEKAKSLLGPYSYTDGYYTWDRDTWLYATKYHVKLPDGFVEYVMSGAGDEFLFQQIPWAQEWLSRKEGKETT